MAALTGDVVVDSVRSVCVTLGFSEAVRWDTFADQPTTAIDQCFRVPPLASGTVIGGFDYTEDRTDRLEIWVARKHGGDYAAVRRALLRDVHSLTAAVARDSGDYHVVDSGRSHLITPDRGAEFVTLRLSLPVNYDCQL